MDHEDSTIVQRVRKALLSFQRFQWEQGCAAQAILEYEGFGDEVAALCEAAIVRTDDAGRPGAMGKDEAVSDPAAIGEALIVAAKATGDIGFARAADRLYEYLKRSAPRTKDGVLYHFATKPELWVDAHYMTPPFLCRYGDVEEAMRQIAGLRKRLFDESKLLLSHIWDDGAGRLKRRDFWGVGNGWAAAGITRVIGMLPQERRGERAYLIGYVRSILGAMARLQRPDGLFHDVLDDDSSFVETNAAQMLAYSVYRGAEAGYLDDSLLPAADRARAAARGMVDGRGFVRGVCGAPNFDAPGIAPEGQAFFLLMEAARRDYLASRRS